MQVNGQNEMTLGDSIDADAAEPEEVEASRAVEILCATVAMLVNGAMVWGASLIPLRGEAGGIDPRWWPLVVSSAGVGMAVILLVLAICGKGKHRNSPTNRIGLIRLSALSVATVLFVLTWRSTDFFIPAVVFLVSMLVIFGERRWKVLTLFPVIMTGFVYVMFHTLLQVPL